MSRAVVHEPVVTQVTATKISNPTAVVAVSQAHDPVSHQFTGTQTATPEQPPS
jgi:hypothetical protein